jgi:hypothetical protein
MIRYDWNVASLEIKPKVLLQYSSLYSFSRILRVGHRGDAVMKERDMWILSITSWGLAKVYLSTHSLYLEIIEQYLLLVHRMADNDKNG